MPLESLTGKHMSMKNCVFDAPEPKPNVLFDIDRDVTMQDRTSMLESLEYKRKYKDGMADNHFVEHAYYLHVLGLNPTIDDLFRAIGQQELQAFRETDEIAFAHCACRLASMGCNLLTPDDVKNLKEQAPGWRRSEMPHRALEAQRSLMAHGHTTVLRQEDVEFTQEMFENAMQLKDWDLALRLAAEVLRPMGIPFTMKKDVWPEIYELLEKNRGYGSAAFAELASHLAMITADEVRITPEGLRVVHHANKKPMERPIVPLPSVVEFLSNV